MKTSGNNPIGICRLCHTSHVQLIDSHLVPRAAYKILENLGGCISVNNIHGILKPNQCSDYLLCKGCEDRFNKGGEDWVMRNCFRGNNFRLREALEHASPFKNEYGVDCFKGSEIAGVNPDKLAYFAASMFWRASCHDWRYEKRSVLGRVYEEQFRKFLLGAAPWPSKAWLTVGCVPKKHEEGCLTFSLPKLDADSVYHSHRIRFLGIMFLLSVGNLVPEEVRTYSVQHTPYRCITMGETITWMVINDSKPFQNIEYKGKAKQLVAPFLKKDSR